MSRKIKLKIYDISASVLFYVRDLLFILSEKTDCKYKLINKICDFLINTGIKILDRRDEL